MDKREAILNRVLAILLDAKTGAGIKTAVRNRGLLNNEKRPAAVLLDADELPTIILPQSRTDSRYTVRGQIVQMKPEMYILLDEKRPTGANADGSDPIGPELNAMRIAISNAICNDADLATLLGANGGIAYNGCVTDLKSGSSLTGQMRIDFGYRYFFDPQATT